MRSPLSGFITYPPVKTPVFSRRSQHPLDFSLPGRLGDIGFHIGFSVWRRQLRNQWVFGGQDEKGYSEQGVWASGKNR